MKKTALAVLTTCVLILLTAHARAGGDGRADTARGPEGFRPLVRHAMELKAERRYGEAAAAVERALAVPTDDTWPGLVHELAGLYLLAGKYDRAEKTCRAILGERSGDMEAKRLLALVRIARARAAKGAGDAGDGVVARAAEETGGPESGRGSPRAAGAAGEAAEGGVGRASAPSVPSGVVERKLEEAKRRARAGGYERAIALYREVLAARPGHRTARRGLARTYSWAKDYDRAIEGFTSLVEEDGEDMESRVGLARVLSWQGRYDESIEELDYVLARDPDNRGARLARARVLWWRGDPLEARSEAEAIVEAEAGDDGGVDLLARLRAATGPGLGAEAVFASDSDGNELEIYRARAHAFAHRLSAPAVDYSVYEASRKDTDGTARVLGAANAMEPAGWLRLAPRLRLVSLDSDVNETTYLAGGLSARVEPSPRLRLFVSAQRAPLVDTARLIRNGIRLDDYSLAALYDLGRATVGAGAAYGEYSDGNTRKKLSAKGAVAIVRGGGRGGTAPDVTGGYRVEYREFSDRTTSGYFNPPEITTHHFYLDVKGSFAAGKLAYHANGRVGTQSHESDTEFTSAFEGALTAHLTENLSAGAAYKWSRSALESASGFRYEELRFTLDYLY